MQENSALGRALTMVRDLRARCPWDRAQTRETLRPYLVEEVLELDHALGEGDRRRDPGRARRLPAAPRLSARDRRGARRVHAEDVAGSCRSGRCDAGIPISSTSATREPWERIKRRERRKATLAGIAPDAAAAAQGLPAAGAGGVASASTGRTCGGPLDKVREELAEVEESSCPECATGISPRRASAGRRDRRSAVRGGQPGAEGRRPAGPGARPGQPRNSAQRFEEIERWPTSAGSTCMSAGLDALDGLWDEVKAGDRAA